MSEQTDSESVDAYIVSQPTSAQRVLRRVRTLIRQVIPDVTEGISYQIPVFKREGHMVCFFAGHAEHYAIYPISSCVKDALRGKIEPYLHGRATVRFKYDDTMPTHLIQSIVRLRAREVAEDTRGVASNRPSTTPKKPAAKKPTTKKPTAKKPAAKKPTTKKPTAKKPAAKKPTAKKPAAKKPTAKKPTAKKPAAKR